MTYIEQILAHRVDAHLHQMVSSRAYHLAYSHILRLRLSWYPLAVFWRLEYDRVVRFLDPYTLGWGLEQHPVVQVLYSTLNKNGQLVQVRELKGLRIKEERI